MTYVYAYAGATREDVHAELDDYGNHANLETMSSPQVAFISTEYSEELIMDLARDMWEEIIELYAEDDDLDRPFDTRAPLEALRMSVSSKVCEYPPSLDSEPLMKEVTEIQFFGEADFNNEEALMQVVVQKHPVQLPKQRT